MNAYWKEIDMPRAVPVYEFNDEITVLRAKNKRLMDEVRLAFEEGMFAPQLFEHTTLRGADMEEAAYVRSRAKRVAEGGE